ncbi:hypothetical protein TSAR_003623 [Trichomalopsis sarcophagae]|uniref:Laccase n=1 Tax=Trichomalopsis sarcophagae TaxID=543379 RepID=A0A232EM42_9HYME|nr:hypothetical protein TSAR_003623 [Trichomalopsis sarcophagae]
MIITDWMNRGGSDGFVKQYYEKPTVAPETILVNGLGRYKKFQRKNETDAYIPSTVFKVKKWKLSKPNTLCKSSHTPGNFNCTAEQCACSRVIHLKLNSVVEIFFVDQANEAVLNPNDENFFNHTADTYDWSQHPCHRPCTEDRERMICKYVFVVEQFSTMSKACYDCPFNKTDCFRPHCLPASGVQKTVFTANRQMPGPAIQVCLDDVVMVEVRNNMLSESTTIHWHGIKQTATPYMDGVPYVTQCPILPGERFQYTFNANISGTYFWHSHIGSQRSDGLAGPLIIYSPPSQNLHANLYDYDEHYLIVNDWMNYDGNDAFVKQYHYTPTTVPQTILINGMGRFKEFRRDNVTANVPSSTFKVQKNRRYRFRLINSGAEGCPIAMSIDNHTMLVIALDSNDIEPVEVEVITTWPGERVDFVLKADQESDNYWIRYRGFDQCSPANAENGGVYQVAILRYDGAADEDPKSPIGYSIPKYTNTTRVLNPYNTGTESSHEVNISIPLLNALTPDDPSLIHPVDQQIFIEFDFYPVNNFDFHRKNLYGYNQVSADHRIGSLQLNHITLKLPTFPLLTQWDMLKPNSLCNASHVPGKLNCTAEHCACTHVINLKLNSVVEIVFLDQGAFSDGKVNHPLHLHGHFFRVVSEKNLDGVVTVDRIKKLDKEGKVKRRLHRAPLKDTIKSPGGGYTIVRLYANNPGYWFFHCHFEQHTNVGMALIFKVGEHKDFAKIPEDFPKCGGFTPITMK